MRLYLPHAIVVSMPAMVYSNHKRWALLNIRPSLSVGLPVRASANVTSGCPPTLRCGFMEIISIPYTRTYKTSSSHTSTRSRFKLLHIGTLSSRRYHDFWLTETHHIQKLS